MTDLKERPRPGTPPVRQTGGPGVAPTVRPAAVLWRIVRWLLLAAVVVIFAFPFVWMVSNALRPSSEIYSWPIQLIPETLGLQNFRAAFETAPFGRYLFNSVLVLVIGTAAKTVLAVTTAYAFVFLDFPFKNALFVVMLGALMVPGHVTLLMNYITVADLGLVNTYAGIILPGVGSAFGTFLLRQRFRQLPREVFEAAELDGSGHLRRMVSMAVPMAAGTVGVVALFAAIDEWNGFIWPLIITNTDSVRTLPISLMHLQTTDSVSDWGIIMAGTSLVVLPMLILFLVFQRYILRGFAGSALGRR